MCSFTNPEPSSGSFVDAFLDVPELLFRQGRDFRLLFGVLRALRAKWRTATGRDRSCGYKK